MPTRRSPRFPLLPSVHSSLSARRLAARLYHLTERLLRQVSVYSFSSDSRRLHHIKRTLLPSTRVIQQTALPLLFPPLNFLVSRARCFSYN